MFLVFYLHFHCRIKNISIFGFLGFWFTGLEHRDLSMFQSPSPKSLPAKPKTQTLINFEFRERSNAVSSSNPSISIHLVFLSAFIARCCAFNALSPSLLNCPGTFLCPRLPISLHQVQSSHKTFIESIILQIESLLLRCPPHQP